MTFVFPPALTPSVAIAGSEQRLPVHRIYCIGRNYADHAKEMGMPVDRSAPVFFCKPADAVVADRSHIAYPLATSELHHEVEMVVALQSGGVNIPAAEALRHVFGYGVGLDLTRRDLQAEAKKQGRPWDTGKAFDASAPCSALVPASRWGDPTKGEIKLLVNGKVRQQGDLNQLIWSVAETIAYLSSLFTLMPGDLIYTGTPAGVAAVQRGDTMEASVTGLPMLKTRIV